MSASEVAVGTADFTGPLRDTGSPLETATLGALDRLQQVEATRTGCGADKSEDCFECVRGGTELQEAITRARSHPAPTLASAYKE